ncbi:Gfo/Idh/MocA family oxidoreductase [bacterium]|nr:Gfo/Idh/MocA family oxidoreductase [bacterium]
MSHRTTRRRFLAAAPAALAAPMYVRARGQNERLNLAVIGVADRGGANLAGVAHENVAVLCDVDPARLGAAKTRFPMAADFVDYRQMFDRASNRFDAVVISTPDHSHCLPAVLAMTRGKHVYCEKPLAYSVAECRLMRKLAVERRLVTQMGTQIHAGDNYRRVVEVVRAGLLGAVTRVHVWLGSKPPAGVRKGPRATPKLDIDLWAGPATTELFDADHPNSPHKNASRPWPHFHWRYWWEFGGGQLADFGCHFMDLPAWALNLGLPTRVEATGRKTYEGDNTVPDVMQVDYRFPAVQGRGEVHLTWYHGVPGPALDGSVRHEGFGSGVLFEGDRGKLLADYGKYRVFPEAFARDFVAPPRSVPASIGHHREWTEAVKSNGPTTCNFDYSGRLAEAVLLGNVAYRAGRPIVWNAETGRTDSPDADRYLAREYRRGWELPRI